jgi:hypothetical protein
MENVLNYLETRRKNLLNYHDLKEIQKNINDKELENKLCEVTYELFDRLGYSRSVKSQRHEERRKIMELAGISDDILSHDASKAIVEFDKKLLKCDIRI